MPNYRDRCYIVKTFRNDRHKFEHDNRASRGARARHNGAGERRTDWTGPASLTDDDSVMAGGGRHQGDNATHRRLAMRMRGRGRQRADRRGGGAHNLAQSQIGKRGAGIAGANSPPQLAWYQIQVLYGRNYGEDFIMKSLKENLSEPFYPIAFAEDTRGRDCSFYVEGQQMNSALMALDQRISTPNGYKMRLISRRCAPPTVDVDADIRDVLKLALSNRYNSDTHTLNLCRFHQDTFLRERGHYLPLHRQPVMTAVVEIIVENVPSIVGIDVSHNRLASLTALRSLATSCRQLKALNASNNWVPSISLLAPLSVFTELVEVNLDGNKLCDSFKTKADYISAVRKHFPKVVLLDNVELPPPVQFDLDASESSANLPSSKVSYFVTQQPRDMVLMFFKQYFEVLDSDNRRALVDAYHEHARFSVAILLNKSSSDRMQCWQADSRNLLRPGGGGGSSGSERVAAAVHHGKQAVITALDRLPRTEHDAPAFTVDVPLAVDKLLQATISGVFRERTERQQSLRAFSRTFIIAPVGQGFCIVNDLWTVMPATSQQIKGAFQTPMPPPVPSAGELVPAVTAAVAAASDPAVRHAVVVKFSQASGMNHEWAAKCLEENNFDYERSALVFNQLKADGKIPAIAFAPQ